MTTDAVEISNYLEHVKQDGRTHHVVGDVRRFQVYSPQLNNTREVLVYLPPRYESSARRYPVLYLNDGQNLFDDVTSFAGQDWHVDETMEQLATEGYAAIVVGINHMGEQRIAEYYPFAGRWQGRGEAYVQFLCETVKPILDTHFRTASPREHTGILGSSMGGLISLFAFFRRPDVFGLCGAMSPSLWIGHGELLNYLRGRAYVPGRIYLDHGTHEPSARPLRDILIEKGYLLRSDLKYVSEHGGQHTESAWARRLPVALKFLLKDSRLKN